MTNYQLQVSHGVFSWAQTCVGEPTVKHLLQESDFEWILHKKQLSVVIQQAFLTRCSIKNAFKWKHETEQLRKNSF